MRKYKQILYFNGLEAFVGWHSSCYRKCGEGKYIIVATIRQNRQNDLLQALIAINRELSGITDLEGLLDRLLHIARDVCRYDNAIIRLVSGDGRHLVPVASFGYTAEALRQEIHIGQGIMGQVAESGEPILVSDISQLENYLFGIPGARSELAVPLKIRQRVVGVLNIESPVPGAFSEDDMEALQTVAAGASLAIEKARMTESLRAVSDRFRKLHALSHHILNSTDLGIFTLDLDLGITSWNPGVARLLECPQESALGRSLDTVIGTDSATFLRKIHHTLFLKGEEKCTLRRTGQSGITRHLEIRILPLRGDGQHFGLVAIVEDISGRITTEARLRENEQRLHQLAFHDSLTHLPNRLMFVNHLRQAMETAHRRGHHVGLLFLDIDHFKDINDSLGHRTGDEVLRAVASRMEASLAGRGLIARLGGDEFVVIIEQVTEPGEPASVARNILKALPTPIPVKEMWLYPTASIGISLFPRDGATVEELMQSADVAMYRAKEQGRNTFCFYNPTMNARANNRLHLESNLRHALSRGELLLHYQPQVELRSGRLVGMEALLRWQHPRHGTIPPGQFIPLAEENGLILAIGEWVLGHACQQAKIWQNRGLPPVRMAVNISPRQFAQREFVALVSRVLESTGLAPETLELEITETALMENAAEAVNVLQSLRKMGVSLAIDDFGTGFSSLSYLQRFPINRLKIDRSFVQAPDTRPDKPSLTPAIIALGRSLGLEILAEGIETTEQFMSLREGGCDLGQGYFFAHPRPANLAHLFHFPPLSPTNDHNFHSAAALRVATTGIDDAPAPMQRSM